MKRLIAVAIGIVATSAMAQTPSSSANPDAGFFRPTDLAPAPLPFVVTGPGPQAGAAGAQPQPATPDPVEEIRRAEEARLAEAQMDRVERENERARREAPAPITGAFTGLTDERNR